MAEPVFDYIIEMIVREFPERLRQQYDDEQACDTALNQLKTAAGAVSFGGWQIKADHIVAFRKNPVEKVPPTT